MCGIVGYAGSRQAAPVLLDGLEKLEYRGYDSAGVCVHNENGLVPVKAKGRLSVLRDRLEGGSALPGNVGIGHTRWATHGAPSDVNSHPHMSWTGKIAVVHNGIIENEARLREKMLRKGATFASETDTEVVANLIGYYYEKYGDFVTAVRETVVRLEGSFALGILCVDHPGKIVAVKKDSPLIFGFGDGEHFVASDVPAILKYTQTVAYLEDGDMAVFDADSVTFYDITGEEVEKKREKITWEMGAAERGGYDHFMIKEIYEQPKALRDTISPRLRDGKILLDGIELSAEYLRGLNKIYLVACGSAYYVSVLAKYIIEKSCRIPCEAMMASEFRYCDPVVDDKNLVIVVSQSGETADTLAALREAKNLGAQTLAIVNVVGSAIAKAADQVIYT
jgi:glucosamine--fructose-6-phosphate aminotransferase (isomerizing)